MREFDFQEIDIHGEEILDNIGLAHRFNQWMYQSIKPWCGGRILEIGSGAGNISNFFLNEKFDIHLSDIRGTYCQMLKEKFGEKPNLLDLTKLNLVDPDFDRVHKKMFSSFDTVFALNVVEHIEDDFQAIRNAHKLLKSGGRLIVLVPSYQFLYNKFDIDLGHYRRYTKKSLSHLFLKSDFEIIHRQYFNFFGMFGWFTSGRILRNKTIPRGQLKIFNTLVPVFGIIDKMIFRAAGLSTIVVGKKK